MNRQIKLPGNSAYTKFRVLIVEDNVVDKALLKAQLEEIGFLNIQDARHGTEGIFKLENASKINKPFHILITDWKMPERDGLSLVKYLKGEKALKNIRIIMLTSVSDAGKVQQALSEGVDDFVLKPIDHKILQKKIENLVSRMGPMVDG